MNNKLKKIIQKRYERRLEELNLPLKKGQSLLQESKQCFITERTDYLHKHHIYGGCNRTISEEEGFFIYLIPEFHTIGPEAVHNDDEFLKSLQEICQSLYEENHTRDEFIRLIGQNYINGD